MPQELVWTPDLLARYWGYYAQFPQTYFSHGAGRAVVRAARRHIPRGAHVLDYGCGPGFLLDHMLAAGWAVAGCEIAPEAFGAHARSLVGRPGLDGLFTARELLDAGRRYDAIFLCEVIEHLDDAPLAETLANIRVLLAPGGRLIVTTPNDEDLAASTIYCPVADVTFHRWQHVRSWSAETLPAHLAARGLAPIAVKTTCFRDSTQALPLALLRQASYLVRKPPNLFVVARRD